MMFYLYAIPTLILVLTFFIYRISGSGFREYVARLEAKVKTIERLSNMIFTKDMLSMFLKTSSLSTQMFFTERQLAEEKGEEASREANPMMSMKDMRSLEASLKSALQPSRDLEKVKGNSLLIRRLMIVYGCLIAAIEYVLVSSTLFTFTDSIILQLDGIVFGITIIFSIFLLLLLLDFFNSSRKINTAYDNVDYGSSEVAKPKAYLEDS